MITTDRTAKLAFLTVSGDGKPILNMTFEELGMARGQALERVEISTAQLAGICADGTRALWAEDVTR
jgi:hypothetical protein